MRKLQGKLTYANVVATLALFLVLAGGTALAATQLAKNSVGTKQIKKGAVTTAKIAKGTRAALAGSTGPKGDPGPPGLAGPGAVPFSYVDTSLPNGTSAPPYQTIATVGPIVLKAQCYHDTNTDDTFIQLGAFSTGPQFDVDSFFENQSDGKGAYTTNSYDTSTPVLESAIDNFTVGSAATERTFISPALISYATASGEVVDTLEGVAYQDGRSGTRRCSFVGSVTPALTG